MKNFLRVLAAGATLVTVAGTGVQAGAEPASEDGSTIVTAVRSGEGERAADVITCKLKTDEAHYSHKADGRRHMANVHAKIKCSENVRELGIRVGLYKNGKIYKRTGTLVRHNKHNVTQNAARRCIKKKMYAGYAEGYVVFPPHYTPRTKKLNGRGPSHYMKACKRGG